MGIVFLVTGEAILWRIPHFLARRMAGGAGGVHMRPRQFEIGQAVVENLAVQAGDVEVAAFVIGMAGFAFAG